VHAVLGNNDIELARVLPETRVVDLDGVQVAMIHDSGARAGRAGRLHRRFPHANAVVFGHSHLPVNESGIDGQLLFNPGSPTQRRMAPTKTVGVLEAEHGRIVRADIVDV
jgi:putative phosphoesterase